MTDSDLTPDDVAAIRARADAATKPPWDVRRYPYGGGRICIDDDKQPGRRRTLIADLERGQDIAVAYHEADREFLLHARTDVPALLDALDAALAALAVAERERDEAAGKVARVEAQAQGWAAQCPPDDWGEGGIVGAIIADAGRSILRTLAHEPSSDALSADVGRQETTGDHRDADAQCQSRFRGERCERTAEHTGAHLWHVGQFDATQWWDMHADPPADETGARE